MSLGIFFFLFSFFHPDAVLVIGWRPSWSPVPPIPPPLLHATMIEALGRWCLAAFLPCNPPEHMAGSGEEDGKGSWGILQPHRLSLLPFLIQEKPALRFVFYL